MSPTLCPVCHVRELTGKQTVCSGACKMKRLRAAGSAPSAGQEPVSSNIVVGEPSNIAPEDSAPTSKVEAPAPKHYPAILLDVATNQPFTHQQRDALALSPLAVHLVSRGKDRWVIPGECKWGPCLSL